MLWIIPRPHPRNRSMLKPAFASDRIPAHPDVDGMLWSPGDEFSASNTSIQYAFADACDPVRIPVHRSVGYRMDSHRRNWDNCLESTLINIQGPDLDSLPMWNVILVTHPLILYRRPAAPAVPLESVTIFPTPKSMCRNSGFPPCPAHFCLAQFEDYSVWIHRWHPRMWISSFDDSPEPIPINRNDFIHYSYLARLSLTNMISIDE